jgi:hypothetical protein
MTAIPSNAILSGSASANSYVIIDSSVLPIQGWQTTGKAPNGQMAFEYWGSGFQGVAAQAGSQFVELNAYQPGALYQLITTPVPAESVISWSFNHRGRDGLDTMLISFARTVPIAGTQAGPDESVAAVVKTNNSNGISAGEGVASGVGVTFTDGGNGWITYSGNFTLPAEISESKGIYINFRAVSSNGGNGGLGAGNFLDNVKVTITTPMDRDTDGDGIPNRLDMDSDGDTCSDTTEAKVPAAKLTGPVGANGVYDALETAPDSGKLSYDTSTYDTAGLDIDVRTCWPALAVNSVTVNESSPYAVFTVSGLEKQPFSLSLTSDSALVGTDTGTQLQWYDVTANSGAGAWINYTPGNLITMPSDGDASRYEPTSVLVRVAITNDTTYEVSEKFNLVATNTLGTTATGVGTILDNGTGDLFSGINTTGTPDALGSKPDLPAANVGLNNDNPYNPAFVKGMTVNEGSPYAVFTVSGVPTAGMTLSLPDNGTAQIAGGDYQSGLEYFDPAANGGAGAWLPYTAGQQVKLGTDGNLLVRVQLGNQLAYEGPESLPLSVQYDGTYTTLPQGMSPPQPGGVYLGTMTIVDDGTGSVFGPDNKDGQPDLPGENGVSANFVPDDDRPLEVTGTTVSEASPYVEWSVKAAPGQPVGLALGSGSAIPGVDTGTALEYFNGTSWVPYTGGSVTVPANGVLGVRTTVLADTLAELSETLDLRATNTSGAEFRGTSTILDQGGLVLPATETPISVSGQTVNEASPYLMFTVAGQEGQAVTLNLSSGSGTVGQDTGTNLEYFDGASWQPYTPGQAVKIPGDGDSILGEPAQLLVRVAVTNDAAFEGKETINLTATTANGLTATGGGAIVDDGTGIMNVTPAGSDDPNTPYNDVTGLYPTGIPAQVANPVLNDDRAGNPPAVDSFTVNEGSPYAVFTVSGVPGAGMTLSLSNGTTQSADYSPNIEVFDPTSSTWVPYSAATAKVGAEGKLLARVALVNDTTFEGPETFNLNAKYNANQSVQPSNTSLASGTATIIDDGTGLIYLANPNDPGTPAVDPNYGVQDGTNAELDYLTPKNDDRALGVSSVSVNEASPYAVFTVTAVEGQLLLLDLASGPAQIGSDTGSQLEYYNPGANNGAGAWQPYTLGQAITVPGDGDNTPNEAVPLLVRVAINQDANYEGPESFTLNATYANNPSNTAIGTGTIVDDGTGGLFGPNNTTGQPNNPGSAGLPASLVKDDDRPLAVNDVTVRENAGYAEFTVTGAVGQYVHLSLANNTATIDADGVPLSDGSEDYGAKLQYFDGTDWLDYTAGSFVKIPNGGNALQVRVTIVNDVYFEKTETFKLIASNAGGGLAIGECAIKDDEIDANTLQIVDFNRSTPASRVLSLSASSTLADASRSNVNRSRPIVEEFRFTDFKWPTMSLAGNYGFQPFSSETSSEVMLVDLGMDSNSLFGQSFGVPTDALIKLDTQNGLHFEAAQTNGQPLPDWMDFDTTKGVVTIKGKVPDNQAVTRIMIDAVDSFGNRVTTTIFIKPKATDKANHKEGLNKTTDRVNPKSTEAPRGKPALSEQIKVSGNLPMKQKAGELLKAFAQTFGA